MYQVETSDTVRMILRVRVRAVTCDDVNEQSKESNCPDPRNARNDQPDDPDNYPAVIDLTQAGDEQTQNTCKEWFSHLVCAKCLQ